MQKIRSFFVRSVVVVSAIFAISFANPGFAQVDRSGLTGTVTDPSGRLLGQTHIVAVEDSTQLRRETVALISGRYDIPELPVGRYTITFDHPGFQTSDISRCGAGDREDAHPGCDVEGIRRRGAVKVSASSELIDGKHRRGDRPDREKASRRTASEWPQLGVADGIHPWRYRHRRQQPAVGPVRRTGSRR